MKPPLNIRRCEAAYDVFRGSWEDFIIEVFSEYTREDARELFDSFFKVTVPTLDEELLNVRVNAAIQSLRDRKRVRVSLTVL